MNADLIYRVGRGGAAWVEKRGLGPGTLRIPALELLCTGQD